MKVTLDLAPQTEERVASEARQSGLAPADWILKLLDERANSDRGQKQGLLVDLAPPGRAAEYLRARMAREATEDPEEVHKADADVEDMMRSMNDERRRSGAEPIF